MKKIAYILTTFPCPSETFAAREIQTLQKTGLDIMVFAASSCKRQPADTEPVGVFYRPGLFSWDTFLSLIYLAVKHPLSAVKLITLVLEFLLICPTEALTLIGNFHTICFFAYAAERYGISYIHAYFLSWPACIGLSIAKITNKPFSIAAHSRDIFVEHGAVELKVSQAKFVVCCSRQGLDYLKARLPGKYHDRLHLNYHGIDVDLLSLKPKGAAEKSIPTILSIGRLVRKKGFEYLIKAFEEVLRDRPNCCMIIAGDGPQKQKLVRLIYALHLAEKVQLPGWLEHQKILELIGRANVLVVPSIIDKDGDRDGIPNVILEAFCLGTPVIASALTGITEAIRHKQTGLLVEPSNTSQLRSALEKILSDKNLGSRISDSAYEAVKKHFDIDTNCKKLIALFENTN